MTLPTKTEQEKGPEPLGMDSQSWNVELPLEPQREVEKRVTREIPVVAAFAGNPAPGYRKVGQSISPPVVTVSGPASEVAKVRRALTGTIVLEGETKNVEVEVRPIPDAPAGSRVRIESPNDPVIVRVTIEPPPAEMLGPAIPESDRRDGDGTTP